MSNWQNLSGPNIQKFIRAHENADVKSLALKKSPDPSWDYPRVMDQIKARQKAKIKMPSWLEHDGIIFPPSNVIEQASSEATATYKASLVSGKNFIDLTGGVGIDSLEFIQKFDTARIIEINDESATLLKHNLDLISDKNITVENMNAEDFIKHMPEVNFVFCDPQRRESKSGKRGLYKFEDCSPNILQMLPVLKEKTSQIMIKTSPMLDIDQAITQLECVSAVHVIEWQGDCKELLFLLDPKSNIAPHDIPITAVALNDDGTPLRAITFTRYDEQNAQALISPAQKYLYEPSPAFMKAGAFQHLAQAYKLNKLAPDTHLYTSEKLEENFPGRIFEIIRTLPVQKKAVKPHTPSGKANISVRNFPMRPAELAKKLGLKDGGHDYLFACKIYMESGLQNTLIQCQKLSKV